MSVSMLLNAANVVTAAERCQAIDEKTGRIPINFLLSRSTDLEDHVKDQLQQLAVTSPSLSILPDRSVPPLAADPYYHRADDVMLDVHHASRISEDDVSMPNKDHPDHSQCQPRYDDDDDDDDPDADDDDDNDFEDDEIQQGLEHGRTPSLPHEHLGTEAEEEALKDIDRETSRPDRGSIMRLNQKRNQTLTRKAIRKHTGAKKLNISNINKGSAMGSSSTRNTTVSSGVQSSVASSASQHSNTPRRRWKEWEDELLCHVVAENGPTRWNNLARHFPGRNGRQVRLRWMNHLQPSLDKRPWRPEEDAVLLEAHTALGNKWALISMRLGGRTDNSVKNRYKSIARRAAREAKAARKQE